jgi:cytochrome c
VPQRFAALLFALAGLALAGQSTGSTDQGVFTAAQAGRGGERYAEECARCHGDDLSGSSFGDGTPALKRPDFMAGRTLQAVFDRIKRGMPFDAPASLDDQVYIDIVAYLLRENGHPTGDMELQANSDVLASILVSRRPSRP